MRRPIKVSTSFPDKPPPPPSPAFKIYGEYFGEYPTQLPGFDGNIFEKVNQRR